MNDTPTDTRTLREALIAAMDESLSAMDDEWTVGELVDYLIENEPRLALAATGPATDLRAAVAALVYPTVTEADEYASARNAGWNEALAAVLALIESRSVSPSREAGPEPLVLTPEYVDAIYAAFEPVSGQEAKTYEGKLRLVEPIIRAVTDYERFRASREADR